MHAAVYASLNSCQMAMQQPLDLELIFESAALVHADKKQI